MASFGIHEVHRIHPNTVGIHHRIQKPQIHHGITGIHSEYTSNTARGVKHGIPVEIRSNTSGIRRNTTEYDGIRRTAFLYLVALGSKGQGTLLFLLRRVPIVRPGHAGESWRWLSRGFTFLALFADREQVVAHIVLFQDVVDCEYMRTDAFGRESLAAQATQSCFVSLALGEVVVAVA